MLYYPAPGNGRLDRADLPSPVLASVFTRPGVYASPDVFVDGFKATIWVAAGFSAAGLVAALTAMRRPQVDESVARAYLEPALAEARD